MFTSALEHCAAEQDQYLDVPLEVRSQKGLIVKGGLGERVGDGRGRGEDGRTEEKMMMNGGVCAAECGENDKEWHIGEPRRRKKDRSPEEGGQGWRMSDGSRSEGAEEEKIGDVGRREDDEDEEQLEKYGGEKREG